MDNPVFFKGTIRKFPVSLANPILFHSDLYLCLKKKGHVQKNGSAKQRTSAENSFSIHSLPSSAHIIIRQDKHMAGLVYNGAILYSF